MVVFVAMYDWNESVDCFHVRMHYGSFADIDSIFLVAVVMVFHKNKGSDMASVLDENRVQVVIQECI